MLKQYQMSLKINTKISTKYRSDNKEYIAAHYTNFEFEGRSAARTSILLEIESVPLWEEEEHC